jgi:hypothetical protein
MTVPLVAAVRQIVLGGRRTISSVAWANHNFAYQAATVKSAHMVVPGSIYDI